jgi:threonyl-tRNA synthetase
LAPEQVRVVPISDAQREAAETVTAELRAAGIRATLDAGHETLNYRIRQGEVLKVPYLAVIGQREADSAAVAVRTRGTGSKQDVMPVAAFRDRLIGDIKARAKTPT